MVQAGVAADISTEDCCRPRVSEQSFILTGGAEKGVGPRPRHDLMGKCGQNAASEDDCMLGGWEP